MVASGQGKEEAISLNPERLKFPFKLRNLGAKPRRFMQNIQSTIKGKESWNTDGDLTCVETILIRWEISLKTASIKMNDELKEPQATFVID